jgi:hypothetical protein
MPWSWYCPLFNADVCVKQCAQACTPKEFDSCPWADMQHRAEEQMREQIENYAASGGDQVSAERSPGGGFHPHSHSLPGSNGRPEPPGA